MMDASEDVENSPAMKQAEKSILDVQNVLSILLELVNQITLTLSTIAAGGEGGVLGEKNKIEKANGRERAFVYLKT